MKRKCLCSLLAQNTRLAFAMLCLICPSLLLPQAVLAAPHGGQVVAGQANISQNGNTTNINQSSQKAAINWQGFSIGKSEVVNFNQPNSSSVTLNRVIGNEKSVIQGALNANGQVFLINSNGVLFSKGSQVNVGGLVASTLDIATDDFMNGNYTFKGDGNGSVINMGAITAADGGYVALLGGTVSNQGVIVATKGTVSLNGGSKVTLNFNGDSLLSVSIDEGALDALVESKQAIYADGGKIILTAKAADDILGAQVNTGGIIQAQTIGDLTGEITVYAYDGTANIDGVLDASAPNGGNGGFIETSGDRVKIAETALITTKAEDGKTGTWLIDPTDFTVGEGGDISGKLLGLMLEGTDVTISSALGTKEGKGDINVNDKVEWNADTTLTLDAENDIYINNAIVVNGENAGLVLEFGGDYYIRTVAGYSGVDADGKPLTAPEGTVYGSIAFSDDDNENGLTINGQVYTLIHSMDELEAINGAANAYYALAQSLDASGKIYENQAVIATYQGVFAGLGHTISNLTIFQTKSTATYANQSSINLGLFGTVTAGSQLRDIGLLNVDLSGRGAMGALAGSVTGSSISGAYVDGGTLHGNSNVGGLVGSMTQGSITDSFTNVAITSNLTDYYYNSANSLGGLLGSGRSVELERVHALGNIAITLNGPFPGQTDGIGGLVGSTMSAENTPPNMITIKDAYAAGNITIASTGSRTGQASTVGGVLGSHNGNMVMENVHYIPVVVEGEANISGGNIMGGLIGSISTSTGGTITIDGVSSTGNLSMTESGYSGTGYLGGLIGSASGTNTNNPGTYSINITNAWASGNVSAGTGVYSNAGGLLGYLNYGSLENSHATGNVTIDAATGNVGGLVSNVTNGSSINNSYATGDVSGGLSGGGLVGTNSGSSISNSYATGNVEASRYIGGLVGHNSGTNPGISNSYATGNVNTTGKAAGGVVGLGGLVGVNVASGTIADSYASGVVGTGHPNSGGLVGSNQGTVSNSFYNSGVNPDMEATGSGTGAHDITGLTSEEMQDVEHYLDGTIDQVLADRAAAAAAEAAARAAEAARLEAERLQNLGGNAPNQEGLAESGKSGSGAFSAASADSISLAANIINTADFAPAAGEYSADVRSVEFDGVVYGVNEDDDDEEREAKEQEEIKIIRQ